MMVVILWLASFITGRLIGLEFVDSYYEKIYYGIGIFSATFLTFLLFLKNIRRDEKWYYLIVRLIGGIFTALLMLYMIAMGSFSNMCAWRIGKTLYQKRNSTTKVVERWYGCGATDSTPSVRKTFKIAYLTTFLGKVSEIDPTELDQAEWSPVYDENGR